MEDITDLIRKKYNTLTNRQKLVAKYFIEHPQKVALHTAKEIGELTHTSETTVIRLCYTLEYSGYSQFQKEFRKKLLENEETDPLVNFRTSTTVLSQQTDLVDYIMRQDMHYIEKTLKATSEEQFQKIVQLLLQANRRVVVGFRSSYASANWLAFSLNIVRGNTFLYRGEIDDAIYAISELDSESVVIALSFPRYARETAMFVEAARKKGATIVAITDDELSPVGLLADLLWKVETPSPSALKGMASIFSVLNALVSGVASLGGEDVQRRLEGYEQTSREFSPFVKFDEE